MSFGDIWANRPISADHSYNADANSRPSRKRPSGELREQSQSQARLRFDLFLMTINWILEFFLFVFVHPIEESFIQFINHSSITD